MAESSGYQYWRDWSGLARTKDGKAQTFNEYIHEWEDWDYKKKYIEIGDWMWGIDFRKLTPEQAVRYAQNEYGIEALPA